MTVKQGIAVVKLKNGDSVIIKVDTAGVPDSDHHAMTFTQTEIEAKYPGGPDAWREYITKNLKYPQEAINKKIQGDVIVQFIVDKDGHVSDVKTISGPAELQDESVRIVRESGTWIPAIQNGHKVKAYKKQPIKYRLEPAN